MALLATKTYFVWGCFPRIEWAPAYIGTWRGWRIPFLLSIVMVAVGLYVTSDGAPVLEAFATLSLN
jgi:hypothetical protein